MVYVYMCLTTYGLQFRWPSTVHVKKWEKDIGLLAQARMQVITFNYPNTNHTIYLELFLYQLLHYYWHIWQICSGAKLFYILSPSFSSSEEIATWISSDSALCYSSFRFTFVHHPPSLKSLIHVRFFWSLSMWTAQHWHWLRIKCSIVIILSAEVTAATEMPNSFLLFHSSYKPHPALLLMTAVLRHQVNATNSCYFNNMFLVSAAEVRHSLNVVTNWFYRWRPATWVCSMTSSSKPKCYVTSSEKVSYGSQCGVTSRYGTICGLRVVWTCKQITCLNRTWIKVINKRFTIMSHIWFK